MNLCANHHVKTSESFIVFAVEMSYSDVLMIRSDAVARSTHLLTALVQSFVVFICNGLVNVKFVKWH